ncbi:MAG: L-2-hydroxyglutarate oxidase [Nitrospinae bacterium]|nr:L-2-hydroxyglutarate oxidase [Nitrospinota bacterium]
MIDCDFLVIGGGVMGVSVARELKNRSGGARVVLIEKEDDCGLHASGRNSGVLHAGFYYSADSLKARFSRQGNVLLTEYCESKGLKINKCGKLVAARDESEWPFLDELLKRGKANGVPLHDITEAEAKRIEPRVKTRGRALLSPTTSSVDPREVMQAMKTDAVREGVGVRVGVRYLQRAEDGVSTSAGKIRAGYVVNVAGLYADKIGKDFGFSKDYRILPFKGLYLYSEEPPGALRAHIYPVPDLRNPFLGVHFTLTPDGRSKIGPTAIPAFWREQYSALDNFDLGEFAEIVARQLGLFAFSNFDFKRLAFEEIGKYSRSKLVSLASALIEGVRLENYKKWGKPGIRAQLLNIKERKLEMDFVLEGDGASMHVLNAVSPAFTCAIPFARHICDEIARLRK